MQREWVVLHPDAIRAFSADPSVYRRLLRRELRRLRDPAFDYPPGLLHTRSAPLRRRGGPFYASIVSLPALRARLVIPRLRRALALDPRGVPAALRRPLALGGRVAP